MIEPLGALVKAMPRQAVHAILHGVMPSPAKSRNPGIHQKLVLWGTHTSLLHRRHGMLVIHRCLEPSYTSLRVTITLTRCSTAYVCSH